MLNCDTSSNFDMIGGMLGFACSNGIGSVDAVKIYSYNAGNSSFDILEHYEQFGIDGSGNVSEN